MAEEIKQEVKEDNTPTVEQLMAELSAAKADVERFKSANDKLSKSEAEMKRQLRAKQTTEEQEAEARAEAERIAQEEREALKTELNQVKAEKAYKAITDEKVVSGLIEAVSNADHTAIAQIIAKECEKAVAVAQQTWLDSRPEVNYGGSGDVMTKEKIMAVKDVTERQRLIAENIDLF
jgi:hypothetical protein